MHKVKYTGSPQISRRIIPLRDLGEEDSDEVLVFDEANDFTQDLSEAHWKKLKGIAGGFTEVVEEAAASPDENAAEVDDAIDDQASDPDVPSSGAKRPSSKRTPHQA